MKTQESITWRGLLRQHGQSYLRWLEGCDWANTALRHIAEQLSDFLIAEIDGATSEDQNAPIQFWNFIPTVRTCCNDLSTYGHPAAVAAYAYVWFLERYRRTVLALKYLTSVYALPLGGRGV